MELFDLHPTVTLYNLSNTYFEGEARRQYEAATGRDLLRPTRQSEPRPLVLRCLAAGGAAPRSDSG